MKKISSKIISYFFIAIFISSCSEEIISIIERETPAELKKNIEKVKSDKKTLKDNKKFNETLSGNTSIKKTINFIGMKYIDLVNLIGQPDIKRLEDPELVIIYKNNICVAHFFFMNGIDQNKKIINFIYTDSKKNVNTNSCIESFLVSK